MSKMVHPSVKETAFNCPHCGAFAAQAWLRTHVTRIAKNALPTVWSEAEVDAALLPPETKEPARSEIIEARRRMASGEVYAYAEDNTAYHASWLVNANVSLCFNCDKLSVWLHDRLVWPETAFVVAPAGDMPADVKNEFLEASRIVDASPRGAVALLRLAVQRLCIHLGGSGENINEDIKGLVERGLDQRVQQALDVVRVVGNNAVHPGEIDLRDDRPAALQLFDLVNLIVEIMITQPAHVARMYENLPAGALAAIDRRDRR